jgi:hypothetical protein
MDSSVFQKRNLQMKMLIFSVWARDLLDFSFIAIPASSLEDGMAKNILPARLSFNDGGIILLILPASPSCRGEVLTKTEAFRRRRVKKK